MQKKVFGLAMIVLLLPVFSIIVYADFASTLNDIANFLKSSSLTGYIVAAQAIEAEDSSKVTRAGSWQKSGQSWETGAGTVLIATNEGATLSFSFTGTSISIVSYRNDQIKAVLTIDGETRDIDTSKMTSSNCVSADYCEIPVASGLSNIQHNVVLKTANSGIAFHADRFLIDTGTTAAPSTTTCTDSDGLNYYETGNVYSSAYSNEGGSRADKCEDKVVVEQICSGNTPSSVRYTCPDGCSNGACIQALNCDPYITTKYSDGKVTSGAGVAGYNTVTEGPICKNGAWYWCTRASQNSNCFGCYTGNLCISGTACQQSPYFDQNNDGNVADDDIATCSNCAGKYSTGTCWKCDFNGDCNVNNVDIELQRSKKTEALSCDKLKDTNYADGVKITSGGVLGYDTKTYGPICRNNVWYWCTQSSKNPSCFGCYTGNSCSRIEEQKPDLTVSEISYSPLNPIVNENIKVQLFIKNSGAAVTKNLDYSLQFGSDTSAYTIVLSPTSNFDGELSIGETATISATVKYTKEGSYRITAKADKNNLVNEENEQNNELSKDINIAISSECRFISIPEIRCSDITDTRISVDITQVQGTTDYRLEWRKEGTERWTDCGDTALCGYTTNPQTRIDVLELTRETSYEFRAKVEAGSCASSLYSGIVKCKTKSACGIYANTNYIDGIKVNREGVKGYDTLHYGPVCLSTTSPNKWYWCTKSSENENCGGCYYGNACSWGTDIEPKVSQATPATTLSTQEAPPQECSSLATIPYSDGIPNGAGGQIKYGFDTLIDGPKCNNGIVYWCTKSSENSKCSKCDVGSCCGGDAYLTGVENAECNGAIIQERYNPRYPKCRSNSCQTRVQAATTPQLITTPSEEIQAPQKCQLGFRQNSQYCDSDGTFRQQKSEGESCNNNFECSTNSCANGKCVDLQKQLEEQRSLIQQILGLLGKLFG